MKLFGRNQKADPTLGDYVIPLKSKYIGVGVVEHMTEQQWLGNDPLHTYEAWMPVTSIFQELANKPEYNSIINILSRIESKAIFRD